MLLYREQSAETVFAVVAESKAQALEQREARLRAIHAKEKEEQSRRLLRAQARHSRFGGFFEVPTLATGTTEHRVRSGVAAHTPNAAILNADKNLRVRRKLADAETTGDLHRSPLELRIALYQHACSFLRDAFNVFIPAFEADISRYEASAGSVSEVVDYDRSNFLRLLRFFLEFHRLQLEHAEPDPVGKVDLRADFADSRR